MMRTLTGALTALACGLGATSSTQDAIANGDTRTISIQHMHTKELTTVTFKRDGRYDGAALEKLNWALRDWRLDEPIKMDPRLFDVAWEVHRSVGSTEPFHVVSAYRSPQTNSMLRNRSRGVAKHSQHMLGKAMDFFLPDISPHQIREVGMRLQRGGVGYYPTANNPFIHLDVGSVRSWPRMSREQLARLFPDGRTVHLPSNGGALEGYEIAKAEIIARGGSVAGSGAADIDEGAIIQSNRRSLWASLFGGDEEEDARPTRGRRATIAAVRGGNPNLLAYANSNSEDGGSRPGYFPQIAPEINTGAAVLRERSDRIRPNRAQERQQQTEVAALAAQAKIDAVAQGKRSESAGAEASPAAAIEALAPKPAALLAPVPLARPSGLKITPDPEAPAAETFAVAALPNGIGDLTGSRLVASPEPPIKPVALRSADIAPAGLPEAVGRLVTADHPIPPERPRSVVASLGQPSPAPPLPTSKPATERKALDDLFLAAATPVSSAHARIATARTRVTSAETGDWTSTANPAAALAFSKKDPSDLKTGKFSGPAVRALPTAFLQP